MTFVDTSEQYLIVSLSQNTVRHVEPGNSVEVALGLYPGTALAVRVTLDDFSADMELPIGARGAAAIFSERGKPLRISRQVTIRMYTWLNYF